MKTTTIEWHNVATDGLPEKSGRYLVYAKDGEFTELIYSASHKLFNVSDYESDDDADFWRVEVVWWAELPKLDEE